MEPYREPDRSVAPSVQPIDNVHFPDIEQVRLSNGVPVYIVPFGGQDIVELKLISRGGKSYEEKTGLAGLTAKMLTEGTRSYSGFEFAQKLDEFGAFMSCESQYESSAIHLTCLEKHLPSILPLMEELTVSPSFPEDEFAKLKKRTIHHLEVEEQNTSYVARREFNKLLYGASHPYGDMVGQQEVKALTIEEIREFHSLYYAPEYWAFVVTGRFDQDQLLTNLEKAFGKQDTTPRNRGLRASRSQSTPILGTTGFNYIEKEDSQQATLRIGHLGFERSHPDFHKMLVVNTILGGYFGSRLMKNIREDKGFTYSISAAWLSFKYAGVWLTQTDVGNQYIQATLDEIQKELKLLIAGGVQEEELGLVKNYMLGRSISARETPGQINEIVSTYIVTGLDFSKLDERFEIIQNITTEEVNQLARKYYHPDQLLITVCGKMNKEEEGVK